VIIGKLRRGGIRLRWRGEGDAGEGEVAAGFGERLLAGHDFVAEEDGGDEVHLAGADGGLDGRQRGHGVVGCGGHARHRGRRVGVGVSGCALLGGRSRGRRVQFGAGDPGFAARLGDAGLVLVPQRESHAK
jgi:hypothetical protein